MREKLRSMIASLRPILQRDGGDVSFDNYDEETRTIYLTFSKANYHCIGANGAMRMLFEKKLRMEFPEIEHFSITEA